MPLLKQYNECNGPITHPHGSPERTRANGTIHSTAAGTDGVEDTNTDNTADRGENIQKDDPNQTAANYKYRCAEGQRKEQTYQNKIRRMRKTSKTGNSTQGNNRRQWKPKSRYR